MKKIFFTLLTIAVSFQGYSQTMNDNFESLSMDFSAMSNVSQSLNMSFNELRNYSEWNAGEHYNMGQGNLGNNWNSIRNKFEEMDIPVKDYVEKQLMILDAYEKLGIELSLSCTPYDNILEKGNASWAESNAVCFANSYSELRTNRESGLSALATSLSGYTPEYGLLLDENRIPNIKINVLCELNEPVDYSILGDWIGKQIDPKWKLEFGPIPHIHGIKEFDFESKKALTAASANYGSALLFVDSFTKNPDKTNYQAEIDFNYEDLQKRYSELAPKTKVDLVTIGCPQASIEEIERTAELVDGKKIPEKRLWVFTSAINFDKAKKEGYVDIIESAGGMVLRETCPEVVHYNHDKVKHILTNSMKAEHYLKSGLNSINT